MFTKFSGKVAHEPWKKPLEFGGNPDHVTLGLLLCEGTAVLCTGGYVLLAFVKQLIMLQQKRPWQRYVLC